MRAWSSGGHWRSVRTGDNASMVGLVCVLFLSAPGVSLTVDASKDRHAISPYIYGTNAPDWKGRGRYLTLARQGGNRMTAYNWENNASNAGNDWHNQNDDFLGGGDVPGQVVRSFLEPTLAAGAAAVVTVPMAGYVAADEKGDGDVANTPNYLETRFVKTSVHKPGPYTYPPDTKDHTVYEDEFVWWVEKTFKPKDKIFFDLDNEPDIWSGTHSRIWTRKPTYAEFLARSIDYAKMIKRLAPEGLVFGPVSYGWNGFVSFQDAPDANGRFFLGYYLAQMHSASEEAGKRLLDVLDVHWYPEAQGGGKRITEDSAAPAMVAARLQAPRSLWDPTYTEDSWITKSSTHGPIDLLPRLQKLIDENYPGTKMSITEYNYGGGHDISGGLAEADVLGIYGRYGLFAAALWPLSNGEPYIDGGFDVFRDYDGNGGHFGDESVEATTSDAAQVSIYASQDSGSRGRTVLVVINKADSAMPVSIRLSHVRGSAAKCYVLQAGSSRPQAAADAAIRGGVCSTTLPAMSATTMVIGG